MHGCIATSSSRGYVTSPLTQLLGVTGGASEHACSQCGPAPAEDDRGSEDGDHHHAAAGGEPAVRVQRPCHAPHNRLRRAQSSLR